MQMCKLPHAGRRANRVAALDQGVPTRNFLLQFVRQFDESPARAAYLKSP